MPALAPPPIPPRTATSEGEGPDRFRLRLTQALATVYTVVATGWLCSLGPIPAIISLAVAKHILVAILMMGLGVDAPRRR
jgi:hypothetical protein